MDKAYHPAAAVVHAHDYGPVEFARRYFDEYRGIRRAIGHVQSARPKAMARSVATRWQRSSMDASAGLVDVGRRLDRTVSAHHAGRQIGSVLGTRRGPCLTACSDGCRSRVGRASARPNASPRPGSAVDEPAIGSPSRVCSGRQWSSRLASQSRECPSRALARGGRDTAVPAGSGGHTLVFQLVRRLERSGPHVHDLAARSYG